MSAPDRDIAPTIDLPRLPPGWRYTTVGEVGANCEQTVLTGPFGTALGRRDFIDAGVPLLTISCLTDQGIRVDKALFVSELKARELSRYRLKSGDLLFSRMASVGRAGIVGADLDGSLFNYHIMRLRLDESKLLPKFFTGYVRGSKQVRDYLSAVNHGATRDGINTEQLIAMPVIVAPLDEQRRIVAEIEKQFTRLDAGVAALQRVRASLKRYRAAVLKAACEGRLVPTEAALARAEGRSFETGEQLLARILTERRANRSGRGKYKEPAPPAASNLPPTPLGWTVASLEQLTSADRVIAYGILMPKEHVPDGVLYVKVRNIKNDRIDLASLQRTSQKIAAQYARASLRVGDLLLSIRGTYGRVADVPTELEGGNITQDTARVAVSPRLDRSFVAWFLRSEDAQDYFKRVARGVAVKGVNIGDVRPCPVLLPPRAEQERIVAEVERRLSVVDELAAVLAADSQRATRLRQSILSRAFSGELVHPL